jgi:hypothetical protein
MALQSSGPISFSQISAEFGLPSGNNLGAYRISVDVGSLSDLPLDTNVPQSGSIKFSDFYGKKLNVVVDLFSVSNFSQRLVARSRYDLNSVVVVGGFKSRPARSSGSKIIVNIDKTVASIKGSINHVAVRTGPWDADTQLEVEIGPNGVLYGSGGDGGRGANDLEQYAPGGTPGSSGLGIEYPSAIRNRGFIQAGSGGGGGGGWSNRTSRTGSITRRRRENRSPGTGGGGGAGYPAGNGGAGGTKSTGRGTVAGTAGSPGTLTTGGAGGVPTLKDNGEFYPNIRGGDGGSNGSAGATAGNGTIETKSYNNDIPIGYGGAGGSSGRAIIIYNNGSGTSITNLGSGSYTGPIVYNTNPT